MPWKLCGKSHFSVFFPWFFLQNKTGKMNSKHLKLFARKIFLVFCICCILCWSTSFEQTNELQFDVNAAFVIYYTKYKSTVKHFVGLGCIGTKATKKELLKQSSLTNIMLDEFISNCEAQWVKWIKKTTTTKERGKICVEMECSVTRNEQDTRILYCGLGYNDFANTHTHTHAHSNPQREQCSVSEHIIKLKLGIMIMSFVSMLMKII